MEHAILFGIMLAVLAVAILIDIVDCFRSIPRIAEEIEEEEYQTAAKLED